MSCLSSNSVWFEEVDTALVSFISDIVRIRSADGLVFSVPVRVRKPEEDFKDEEYPCITIYNLYGRRDDSRYSRGDVIVDRDVESKKIIMEKSPIPFNLQYQIDFWATKQTDMNEMTLRWLSQVPDRYFNLNVLDRSGNPRTVPVISMGGLEKSDLLNGSNRIFHSMLTYKVQVEIDERIRKEYPMVLEVICNKKSKGGLL